MNTLGMRLIASVVDNGDASQFVSNGIKRELLSGPELQVYDYVSGYIKSYGTTPSREVINQKFGPHGVALPIANDPAKFYADEVKKRFINDQLVQAFNEASPFISSAGLQSDPERALKILTEKCMSLSVTNKMGQIMDYREAGPVILTKYHEAQYGTNTAPIYFGWPSLDKESAGALPGDLISIIGRPAAGKTFLGLRIALHNWLHQRKVTVFLSMEMLPEVLAMRAAAIHAQVNLGYFQKGQLSTKSFEKIKNNITKVHGDDVPFYIIDGNLTSTVEDLWNLAQTLRPDHIIVDGAYLLAHPNARLNRFDRVAENSRLLKSAVATNLKVPVTCSWQFNREAAKKAKAKKGGDRGDLEDIGFADEIGQLSSLALGLYQPDSVETLHRRNIQIIKGRNGECSSFDINWDFRTMDFSETVQNQIEELNYV